MGSLGQHGREIGVVEEEGFLRILGSFWRECMTGRGGWSTTRIGGFILESLRVGGGMGPG